MMKSKKVVKFYMDYKSPFSYLAVEPCRQMEKDIEEKGLPISVLWLPHSFSIRDGFGTPGQRTPLQLAKVKYAYRDCRRFANERGLVIYGPKKAYDSAIVLLAGIFCQIHCPDLGPSSSSSSSSLSPLATIALGK
eukprot:TRINITY_DN888_c0_g2_i2.p2 TRINITY_DN888_c0_g2~~TRINITY_DN888_c0_g2_i2.p2  ORF type:complete len:152 (-),score=56.25 TRINITY_DN888_c0_g2_i2:52-456(-)